MPLDKSGSKEAFSNNVAAERHAGKPEAQAVAIAYSTQRQAQRHSHDERQAPLHQREMEKYGR